jgi:cytoskeleton protein RodZ
MPAKDLERQPTGDPQAAGDEPGEEAGAPASARTLGAILRTAREARGMTTREVAEHLRIPATYLTMLEANDYGAIADELYLLPFVRSYGDFLGLESGTLSTRFLRAIQPVERFSDPVPEPIEDIGPRHSRWFTTAAVMLFVALALYLVGLK